MLLKVHQDQPSMFANLSAGSNCREGFCLIIYLPKYPVASHKLPEIWYRQECLHYIGRSVTWAQVWVDHLAEVWTWSPLKVLKLRKLIYDKQMGEHMKILLPLCSSVQRATENVHLHTDLKYEEHDQAFYFSCIWHTLKKLRRRYTKPDGYLYEYVILVHSKSISVTPCFSCCCKCTVQWYI